LHFRPQHAFDDAGSAPAVLRAVRGVDLVIDVVRLDEENVFVDATGVNVRFVTILGAAEPGGGASVDGSDEEVVAVADDSDNDGVSQGAIASPCRDL
jgi:hypothetical protein